MGELSEVCDVCGKDFPNRSSFSSHLKTHEDKEYNCHCGKAFSKRQTLQYHKQTAHDSSGSSIKCDCCDKEFKRKSELQKHLKERDFKETRLAGGCFSSRKRWWRQPTQNLKLSGSGTKSRMLRVNSMVKVCWNVC